MLVVRWISKVDCAPARRRLRATAADAGCSGFHSSSAAAAQAARAAQGRGAGYKRAQDSPALRAAPQAPAGAAPPSQEASTSGRRGGQQDSGGGAGAARAGVRSSVQDMPAGQSGGKEAKAVLNKGRQHVPPELLQPRTLKAAPISPNLLAEPYKWGCAESFCLH